MFLKTEKLFCRIFCYWRLENANFIFCIVSENNVQLHPRKLRENITGKHNWKTTRKQLPDYVKLIAVSD